MSKTNGGGPAFPCHTNPRPGTLNEAPQGMTLRDYFAAKAMGGALSDPNVKLASDRDIALLASSSYRIADAMLRARESS